jgi:hypothetical protein
MEAHPAARLATTLAQSRVGKKCGIETGLNQGIGKIRLTANLPEK